MPLRSPVYLDIDLLVDVADYLGLDYPVETKVRETGARERSGSAGVAVPGTSLGVKGAMASTNEVERTYETPVRPVKVLNEVIDRALLAQDLLDFTGGANEVGAVSRRSLVQIEGVARLSAASDGAQVLSGFMSMVEDPQLAQFLNTGDTPLGLMQELLGGATGEEPVLFELDTDTVPVAVLFELQPGLFHRSAGMEDISGDLTLFALVDQLVPEGSELDLVRFLLPGANRAARRTLGREQLDDLLSKMPNQTGGKAVVEGPAWLLKPVAVY